MRPSRSPAIGDAQAGQHDDDDDIGQRLDEVGRHAVTLETDLRRVEETEQQRAERRAPRALAAEIERRQRDEAAPAGDALVEQPDDADREMRARRAPQSAPAKTVEASRIGERREADGAHRRLRGAGSAQPQAPARALQREGGERHERPGGPGQRVEMRERAETGTPSSQGMSKRGSSSTPGGL